MEGRIRGFCSSRAWQYTAANVLKNKLSFNGLKIAEIGCGTGTFALTFRLLGAEATLIDNDPEALEVAKGIFGLYNQKAVFIQADVLGERKLADLKGKFDLVVSCGLAEHFKAEERQRCFDYHYQLLKKGGIAYIGVPNRLSFPYQAVKLFRKLSRTWDIEIEKPFTYWELINRARKVNLHSYKIIGGHSLMKDIENYSLGLVSAFLNLCPYGWRQRIKDLKNNRLNSKIQTEDASSIVHRNLLYVSQHREEILTKPSSFIDNYLSAGIVLIGIA